MIEVIAFDCWGTLFTVNQRPYPFQVFAEKLGTSLDNRGYLKSFEEHLMTRAYSSLEAPVVALLRSLHIKPNGELIKELVGILESTYDHQTAYDDTEPVLNDLAFNYRLALLSNTFKQGFERLKHDHQDVFTLFDELVVSYGEGILKPQPELFERLTNRIGIPPNRIMFVGDHPHDDVEPARAAGMQAVLLDRWDSHPEYPDRIRSLHELSGLL